MNLAALRRAIEDVERAAAAALTQPCAPASVTVEALARLYSTYAQAVLDLHGIPVDLEELCCPPDRFPGEWVAV